MGACCTSNDAIQDMNTRRNTDIKLTEPLMDDSNNTIHTIAENAKLTYGENSKYEEISPSPKIMNAEEIGMDDDDVDMEHKENTDQKTESEEYIERNTFLSHLSSLKLGAADTNATVLTYRTHSFSESESDQSNVSSLSEGDVPMMEQIKRYMENNCADDEEEYKEVIGLFDNLCNEEYDTDSIFYDIENALQSNIHKHCSDSVYWELSLYLKCQRINC